MLWTQQESAHLQHGDYDGIIISMTQTYTFLLRSKHIQPAAPLSMHLACSLMPTYYTFLTQTVVMKMTNLITALFARYKNT